MDYDVYKSYCGSGQIEFDSGYTTECEFEAQQLFSGKIVLLCSVDSPAFLITNSNKLKIEGTTLDGQRISVVGSTGSSTSIRSAEYRVAITLTGNASIYVGDQLGSEQIVELSVPLLNFPFVGEMFSFSIEEVVFVISKMPSYQAHYEAIKQKRELNTTCILTCRCPALDIKNTLNTISAICDLLTISIGTKVNWLDYEVAEEDQSVRFRMHNSRIGRRYNERHSELISYQWTEEVRHFLQKGYAFFANEPQRNLMFIANAFSDIKSPSLFLESRCLLLFSLIEYLCPNPGRRRWSLKRKLKAFFHEFSVAITDDEIDDYIPARNDLTHELSFGKKSPQEVYSHGLYLLHRMVMSMIGYEGHYYNILDMPEWDGTKTHRNELKEYKPRRNVNSFYLYQDVILTQDIPANYLRRGDVVTILEFIEIRNTNEYDVRIEIANAKGEVLREEVVPFNAIERLNTNHLPAVRLSDV